MGQAELTGVRRARPRESANEASGGTGAGGGGTTPSAVLHELAKHPDDSLPQLQDPNTDLLLPRNDSSEGIALTHISIWLNIPLSKSSAFFKPLSICETLAVGMAIITP